MALDLFKFLRGNSKRKEKKNYDPSNPLSSTKFLEGMEDTSVKRKPDNIVYKNPLGFRGYGDPKIFPIPKSMASDVATDKSFEDYALDVGRNAATSIPSNAEIVGRGRSATRRIGTPDPEMGYEGAPKPLGGLRKPKPQPTDKEQIKDFRERLQAIRNKRKSAAQARYDEQMKARNERVTAMRAKGGRFRPTNLKPEDLKTLRQANYDKSYGLSPLGENTLLGRASANRQQRQLVMKQRNIAREEAKDKEDNK